MLLKQIFHKKSFVKSSQHPANLKPAQEILNNECKGCVGLERDLLTRSWLQQNSDTARYDDDNDEPLTRCQLEKNCG